MKELELELEIKKYKDYYKSKFNKTRDTQKIKDIILEDYDKFIKFISIKLNATIDYEIESETKFSYNLRTFVINKKNKVRTYYYCLESDRLYTECYNEGLVIDNSPYYHYCHHIDICANLLSGLNQIRRDEIEILITEYINTIISKEEKEKINNTINNKEEIKSYDKKRL